MSLKNYGLLLLGIFFLITGTFLGCKMYVNRWETYVSEEGKFSIYRPANRPTWMIYHMKTDAGEIDVHIKDTVQHGVLYTTNYCDYPKDFVQKISLDKIFANGCGYQSDLVKGNFISKRSIKLKDHLGVEVRYYLPNKDVINKARMYLVSNRLYQITLTTFKERDNFPNEAEVFLDSFKLIEEK